jgi:hypothetical protein
MGYYLPEAAPAKPNLPAKNRVWGFSGESVSVCFEIRRSALESHQENYAETADSSGQRNRRELQ